MTLSNNLLQTKAEELLGFTNRAYNPRPQTKGCVGGLKPDNTKCRGVIHYTLFSYIYHNSMPFRCITLFTDILTGEFNKRVGLLPANHSNLPGGYSRDLQTFGQRVC